MRQLQTTSNKMTYLEMLSSWNNIIPEYPVLAGFYAALPPNIVSIHGRTWQSPRRPGPARFIYTDNNTAFLSIYSINTPGFLFIYTR